MNVTLQEAERIFHRQLKRKRIKTVDGINRIFNQTGIVSQDKINNLNRVNLQEEIILNSFPNTTRQFTTGEI